MGKFLIVFRICLGFFQNLLRIQTPGKGRNFRHFHLSGEHLALHIQSLYRLLQLRNFRQTPVELLPIGQRSADRIHLLQMLSGSIPKFPGLGHPAGIFLRRSKGKSHLMIFQFFQPVRYFYQTLTERSHPFLKGGDFRQRIFQSGAFPFQLGQQAAAVIAYPVFQILQAFGQPVTGTAFIAGGHQRIQPTAQSFIIGHRQIAEADKTGTKKYAPLHSQQFLAAVGCIQFCHRQASSGFVGPEFPHGYPTLGFPLDGDIPALPVQVDPACHRTAGPGRVTVLIRQSGFGTFCPGLQAVEHGHKECTPGAFTPFVGGLNHIQILLQVQGLVFQFAEGGSHGIDSHNVTSLPNRIFREISAAKRYCSLFSSDAASIASRKIRK